MDKLILELENLTTAVLKLKRVLNSKSDVPDLKDLFYPHYIKEIYFKFF
jgi:hypothetical protein